MPYPKLPAFPRAVSKYKSIREISVEIYQKHPFANVDIIESLLHQYFLSGALEKHSSETADKPSTIEFISVPDRDNDYLTINVSHIIAVEFVDEKTCLIRTIARTYTVPLPHKEVCDLINS